ncbi:Demethylmenaquinone methyltransferase [Planctomycetes bacterium CA13]|uniref:Demethylmenaquinone methyltransferase n=2 Tax=Novipirellula herctigrandis TaxID=2527986 RepID=A0A5C5YNN9_9BACT|nr:Demethylmenaquinone methyltransferase [Planctomycetes bacterium CA13]
MISATPSNPSLSWFRAKQNSFKRRGGFPCERASSVLGRSPFTAAFSTLLLWLVLTASLGLAQEVPSVLDAPAGIESVESAPPKENARRVYLGRIVAQYMSHAGAPWLVRANRDQEENASESFTQLGLTQGMTVCDLGCGNGYWTLPMAKAVGETGSVLAVDIQPEMLQKLRARAGRERMQNIQAVLGKINDPNLPKNEVDLVLMVDVYHEFSHPESMLWHIHRALKPTGVIALLEYREEDPTVPIKPLHRMSKSQIIKEYEQNHFKLVRECNKLPWQHLMFFARSDSPLEAIPPKPTSDVLKDLK